jgi:hemolysin activation/secretion protein
VPFFLMPTLGGGDYLRGYSSYRFRDRNALLLQAEYRWAVHPMLDVAGLYEAGTVSPTVHGLRIKDMAQSVGGGIRVHSKTSGLLRVDLARGRDGLKLAFGVGLGAS